MRKLTAILCMLLMFIMLPMPALAAVHSPTELDELRGVVEGILGKEYTYVTAVEWDSVVVEVEDGQFYDLCDLVQSNPVFDDMPLIVQMKSGQSSMGRDAEGWYFVVIDPPKTGDTPSGLSMAIMMVLGGTFALTIISRRLRAAHTRERQRH